MSCSTTSPIVWALKKTILTTFQKRLIVHRKNNKKLVGDVFFEEVEKKAKAITPVPGGVGPMTIAMLLKNTLKSASSNFD